MTKATVSPEFKRKLVRQVREEMKIRAAREAHDGSVFKRRNGSEYVYKSISDQDVVDAYNQGHFGFYDIKKFTVKNQKDNTAELAFKKGVEKYWIVLSGVEGFYCQLKGDEDISLTDITIQQRAKKYKVTTNKYWLEIIAEHICLQYTETVKGKNNTNLPKAERTT